MLWHLNAQVTDQVQACVVGMYDMMPDRIAKVISHKEDDARGLNLASSSQLFAGAFHKLLVGRAYQ